MPLGETLIRLRKMAQIRYFNMRIDKSNKHKRKKLLK